MKISERILQAMRALKGVGMDKIEEYNAILDAESRTRYIAKICKEDGVDEAEAWRLVHDEPKYSMGFKMCSPSVVMALQTKRGKAFFRDMLTDDERAVFDSEVDGKINFKKAFKAEYKKQKKAR